MKRSLQITISLLLILHFSAISLFSQQRNLYILNRSGSNIMSLHLDSANAVLTKQIKQDVVGSYDMVNDSSAGKLYWTRQFPSQIMVADDGDTIGSPFITDVGGPVDLDIDYNNHKMYWADNRRHRLYRVNLDGTGQEVIGMDTFTNLSAIAVYPSHDLLFFSDLDSTSIWSSSLDGNNRKNLMNDADGFPVRLAVDTINEKLYWSDDGRGRIERMNFDGSGRELIYQGVDGEYVFGLYLDLIKAELYWSDYGTNHIMRSTLDGMDVVPIVSSGLNDPLAITIVTSSIVSAIEEPGDKNTESENESHVQVYPNPANDQLTISFDDKTILKGEVRIIDVVGKQVYFNNFNQPVMQIELQNLSEGYYTCLIFEKGHMHSGHFCIIH